MGFQLKGSCCGSAASQKRQKNKSVTHKSQKTCNFLCSLGVPLSNEWKSQRIPVLSAPLTPLVLEIVQKEAAMDRLQILFASNAD